MTLSTYFICVNRSIKRLVVVDTRKLPRVQQIFPLLVGRRVRNPVTGDVTKPLIAAKGGGDGMCRVFNEEREGNE